ncbi:MAG: LytTR family DNA-binding domain-containing protein [Lachnospiraceae bacterium]|jgi:DNA-binding LytR/AlgR family response regulator|nr:LytTR family DNA-binding domain-containing protein [Lachnospiraceae bacterium]
MNIAICDDEKVSRATVLGFLKPYTDAEDSLSVAQFESGEALLAHYKEGAGFHLIFLDVEMDSLSGVETAKQIREIDKNVMFIFITAHPKYVPDAFIVGAFQFLTKPLQEDFFGREFERAMQTYRKTIESYKISHKGQTTILKVGDILYIETYGRLLRARTRGDEYEFGGSISEEGKKLFDYDFIRCHKGYLVNMKYIASVHKGDFVLTNGAVIPISKHMKNEVLGRFNRFVSGGAV